MRPFKCDTCHSRFFRKDHLTRNEKQHIGKSITNKEKFKTQPKVIKTGKDSRETESDAALVGTSGVKGKLFKINISMREKDLANKQLSPSQLSSILLNQKQLERVAKTSKLLSTPKQSQRLALSHKKPLQAHITPKQDEKSLKTPTAKDQVNGFLICNFL